MLQKTMTAVPFLLLSTLLFSCSYTSQEEMVQHRFDEGTYVVYWENKETGFQTKMKGIFDRESAFDLAEQKQALRPENEYWIERVR